MDFDLSFSRDLGFGGSLDDEVEDRAVLEALVAVAAEDWLAVEDPVGWKVAIYFGFLVAFC